MSRPRRSARPSSGPAPSSSNCLIQELRETIHPAEPEDIEAEIYDLGLGNLYRRYSGRIRLDDR